MSREGDFGICDTTHPSYVVVFPCYAGITTSFKTKSPSRTSLSLTLELYLLETLCLTDNSHTWATSLNLSTSSSAHSNPALFTS